MLHIYPAGQAVILIGRILSETCTLGFKDFKAVEVPALDLVWSAGIDTDNGLGGVDCVQGSGDDSILFASHK
jgi:hypothetical protein